MHPILYQSPDFILYTQTLLFIVAFMAGLLLAIHASRQLDIPQFELTNVVLIGFISSIAGGRVCFLLLTQNAAYLNWREVFTLGKLDGGFAFHGGLVFGGIASWLVTRHYRLSAWRMGDALAPGLAIAMLFLRLGCLMNGCDYGVPTTVPWAILLHGSLRHPIQLYEGLGNLMLLPGLLWINRRARKPGTALLAYLGLSSLLRVGVDIFRDDPVRYWHLTIPQFFAISLAFAAGVLFWQRARQAESSNQKG